MATILKTQKHQRPLTEREGIRAACQCLNWDYRFENVYYHQNTEADLLLISKSGYLTEVEVKCTLADWNNDLKKFKRESNGSLKRGQDCIKYFYYAVPRKLIDKEPEWVSKSFGLIAIDEDERDGGFRGVIIRPAQILSKKRASRYLIWKCFKSSYYRYREALVMANLKADEDFQNNFKI